LLSAVGLVFQAIENPLNKSPVQY